MFGLLPIREGRRAEFDRHGIVGYARARDCRAQLSGRNRTMKLLPAVAVLTLLTAAMASAFRALPAQAETCTDPDNVTYVQGSDHCLSIQTYWAGGNPDTLAVYIHGDVPSGRPVDFVFGIARAVALRGANAVVLIRPGFRGAGRKSSGMPTHSRYAFERYTLPEIESMGDALARLKAHHRAKRLVLMGSSGGALDLLFPRSRR